MNQNFRLHDGKRGAALAVHVIPRALQNQIVEIGHDGAVKIRLNASGDEAEMNRTLVAFLAEVLSVSEAKIEVVAGKSTTSKLVSILEMSTQVAHERILAHLA